jgi:hypothetical protein
MNPSVGEHFWLGVAFGVAAGVVLMIVLKGAKEYFSNNEAFKKFVDRLKGIIK